jgi:hypothetical protein
MTAAAREYALRLLRACMREAVHQATPIGNTHAHVALQNGGESGTDRKVELLPDHVTLSLRRNVPRFAGTAAGAMIGWERSSLVAAQRQWTRKKRSRRKGPEESVLEQMLMPGGGGS